MIKVSNRHFYDQYGRQILLHGVNMVCKKPEQNYICHWDDEDFSNLHKWGLNVIRFGIYWDALEPEPGVYNDEYIEKIKKQLLLAKKYDLMIILDMHQDLYSSEFGGGAPAWATLADGEKYESGVVWSDAYLFNKAVQKAFDNFRSEERRVGKEWKSRWWRVQYKGK